MALNNCDITSQVFDENIGSNLSGRSANDRTLLITPQAGYVIDKTNFTIPNPLPTGVASITLTDTGFPGEPDNNVQVLVAIENSYSASASNNVITLGITGEAKLAVSPIGRATTVHGNAYVHISDPSSTNLSIVKTLTSGVVFSGTDLNAAKSTKVVKLGVKTKLVSYQVTANAGHRFLKAPSIELLNNDLENYEDGRVSLKITEVLKNVKDNITRYTFDVNYYSEVETFEEDNLKYKINYEVSSIPTGTNEIKRVDFGPKQIGKLGATRKIKVFGDVGAKFHIEVKETGQSPFFSKTSQEIKSIGKYYGKNKGVNFLDFDVEIPAKSTSTTYEIKVTQDTGTTFNTASMGGSSPQTFIINQLANPLVRFSTAMPNGATYAQPSDIDKLGRPNKTSDQLSYIPNLNSFFPIEYSLTSTASSVSIAKQPEHRMIKRRGDVRSNTLNRIFMPKTSGLITGMYVVEHSNDTSLPSRVIQTIVTDQYVEVSVNFAASGNNKEFSFIKSDWSESSLVPHLNGGTDISIFNLSASVAGQVVTIKGLVNIEKFGSSNLITQLRLGNIITES